MEQKDVLNAVKQAKEASKERNFKQSMDLSVVLKDVDLKRPENRIDVLFKLPKAARKMKVCAFVGNETEVAAKKLCDKIIPLNDFKKYEKRDAKKIVREYDFFIAQANLMPQIAASFGKYLGTLSKMPNPKHNTIFPVNANLDILVKKLNSTVKLSAKKQPVINCIVGKQEMSDEDISNNIMAVFNEILHHLPEKEKQIAKAYVKTTMGKPVRVW